MATTIDCEIPEAQSETRAHEDRLEDLFTSVAAARESALLLDFDGTLAPFRLDPSKVKPWAGVAALLDKIQETKRTRLAIISGRSAGKVISQLGMSRPMEIWGLHGAERLWPDGRVETQELTTREQDALNMASDALQKSGLIGKLALRLEDKRNAVVVHWRGNPARSVEQAQEHVANLLRPIAMDAGLEMLLFDGGIEVRTGQDKGDAVRSLLTEIAPDAPIAYLGDDTTDEDAFEALGRRGFSILVRREWRPTAAQFWLRPPLELRMFLSRWLSATRG